MTVLGTREGRSLVFTRTYAAPLDDVWAACTEPARLERWIGTWAGDPAAGEVRFRMTAEGDDVPEEVYDVELCEPPRRFVLRSREAAPFSEDGSGPRVHWRHTLELDESDGLTTLRFTQAVPEGPTGAAMVASVGPGWDYYLDRLTADLGGADVAGIDFEPYLERSEHYRALFG
ncbi:SRPBCC domain-containing protein [Nocardioides plantarum]|uniref:SRPBCC domain-containing protein n=1 Tax=Nocardioides plantarum TaxID=29299 RepID=A0ABV5KAE2_9ACTN|nr:SRPBCC domain-containing protein [Nocardioides plantarum]